MRQIKAIILPNTVTPAPAQGAEPVFVSVDISTLWVDPSYQRDLSERSVALIHRIVKGWNWRSFKPPVVTPAGNGYLVLDGQHTAIAAATHGGIGRLPVMVVEAEGQGEQARAFLGHNRDRVNITNAQMFFAALSAGDETALDTRNVCERAGATILKNATPGRTYKPGEIAAVTTLVAIVKRRTAQQARRIVEICVKSKVAPISATLMKAVEELVTSPNFAGEIADEDIASTIIKLGPDLERKATEIALAKRLQGWRASAIVIFQNTRKRRGSASAD